MIKKRAAHEIPNLRMSSLGTVDTHKVRMFNHFSFEVQKQKED